MKKHTVIGMVLCLLPAVAFFLVYDRLPDQVPVHFDITGQADGFLPKTVAVFGIPALFMVIQGIQAAKLLGQEAGAWRFYLIPGIAWVVTAITLCAAIR